MVNQTGKQVYQLALPVRWVDMDAFGHVNASVYFTYFEQTRIAWLTEKASPDLLIGSIGPVVINTSCSFLKSIIYPENILIKLSAGPPGRSSFETFYHIVSEKKPDILYAEGYAKIVWVDRNAERSVPIPDELRQFLPE